MYKTFLNAHAINNHNIFVTPFNQAASSTKANFVKITALDTCDLKSLGPNCLELRRDAITFKNRLVS